MNRKLFFVLVGLSILALLLLQACAQIVPPTGGDEDEDPPVMDSLRSTPNFQTNFQKQDLVFYFDEWVELKNPTSQVIISPEMKLSDYSLDIRKKSVVFSFDKDFIPKENITYIINFGESIVDYTEGNPVPNMRYVFSTGPEIDSLSFQGNVKDAVTGKPVAKAVVILNDNLSDTAFTKVNPLYVTRTDATGNFELQNLKSDTFQVCVLLNSTNDYFFNPPQTSSFGFLDSMIILDTNRIRPVQMWMSTPEPVLAKKGVRADQMGRIAIGFNRSPLDVAVNADPPRQQLQSFVEKDSLIIWYTDPDTAAWTIFLRTDTSWMDSVNIVPSRLKTDLNFDLEPVIAIPTVQQNQNPFDTFKVLMNYPILEIDEKRIAITKDSVRIDESIGMKINENNPREIYSSFKFTPGAIYRIEMMPEALLSLYGTVNDTMNFDFKMLTAEDLSKFDLNITNLDSTMQYIFSFQSKDGKILDRQIFLEENSKELSYKNLNPGEYSATLILDKNTNGKWDGGDFVLKRQPEKRVTKEFGKFLANFDRTEDWMIPRID